MKIGLPRYR